MTAVHLRSTAARLFITITDHEAHRESHRIVIPASLNTPKNVPHAIYHGMKMLQKSVHSITDGNIFETIFDYTCRSAQPGSPLQPNSTALTLTIIDTEDDFQALNLYMDILDKVAQQQPWNSFLWPDSYLDDTLFVCDDNQIFSRIEAATDALGREPEGETLTFRSYFNRP